MTKVICLTPVKNEAWILKTTLACTEQWADVIILLDQGSTDETRSIASQFKKVHWFENESTHFNEPERQKRLLEIARSFEGERLLVTLDADETFTANALNSPEWQKMLAAPLGSTFYFRWINPVPGFERYWIPDYLKPLAYKDDGREHIGKQIHSPRIPTNVTGAKLHLNDIAVLHFQLIDPFRLASKYRWYRCFELLNKTRGTVHDINDFYEKYFALSYANTLPLENEEWFQAYEDKGIAIRSNEYGPQAKYWWDAEVEKLIATHGPQFFRKLDIWDNAFQRPLSVNDPRSLWDRAFHHAHRRFHQLNASENYGIERKLIHWYLRLAKHLG